MARDFDGVDDVVAFTNAAAYDITADITVAAWINKDDIDDYGGIIAKCSSTQWDYLLSITAGNELNFYSDSIGGLNTLGVYDYTLTGWHTIAFRRIGTAWAFLVDGAVVHSGTDGTALSNRSLPIEIGRDGDWGDAAEFDGKIAEAAVWAAGLTDGELGGLARGAPVLRTRRDALRLYCPLGLASPEPDFALGRTGTVTGAIVSAHPGGLAPLFGFRRRAVPVRPAIYAQTAFQVLNDDGTGLGEAA